MLGQSFVENLLDQKLQEMGSAVRRETSVQDIQVTGAGCVTTFSSGETIHSNYVIGADGSRSFVRERFQVSFEITRPQIVWAVIDGIIQTDFPKVPEIIVFQAETSDVAWIPREGEIDRFYIRMDTKDFTVQDAIAKVNRAMHPHHLSFQEITWFSQFSVKESVAEKFQIHERVFLAGDACHIHSVNGGQGLNTGISDAFNLIWKLSMVANFGAPSILLSTYETERKPIALSVIQSSGELVRSQSILNAEPMRRTMLKSYKSALATLPEWAFVMGRTVLRDQDFLTSKFWMGTKKRDCILSWIMLGTLSSSLVTRS